MYNSAIRFAIVLAFAATGEWVAERRHAEHLDRGDDDRRCLHGRGDVRPDHVELTVDQPVDGDGGGPVAATTAGFMVSLVQANLSHRLSIDQFVVGLTLNLFVLGLALFLDSRWEAVTSVAKPTRVPLLSDIPLVGDALRPALADVPRRAGRAVGVVAGVPHPLGPRDPLGR